MFLEAVEVDPKAGLEADVCIVGAGAAGITLALELRDSGLSVLLLESGGFEVDSLNQALYGAEQVGVSTDPLHLNRLRVFGGTTGHWGGVCFPLDDLDFEVRSWVPYSGWPFSRSELDAGYVAAHRILKIDDPDYRVERWMSPEDLEAGVLLQSDLLRNFIIKMSRPPVRMGTEYRATLEADPKLRVVFHANAVEVEVNESASSVGAIRVQTLGGAEFRVKARRFVLASGALENARLLLASNSVAKTGLGNDRDLVGRFFMQHIQVDHLIWAGDWEALRPLGRGTTQLDTGIATSITPEAAREYQMGNWYCLRFERYSPSRRQLVRRTLRQLRSIYLEEDIEENVAAFVAGLEQEVGSEVKSSAVRIAERPEQAPNPDSRVWLGEERDALGMRRLVMDWRITDFERHTLDSARMILIRELGRLGMGRIRDWPDDYVPGEGFLHGGNHHYGTTRMHDDPSQGVTDRNARVHGIENLYIAGGSIFPTSGVASPTVTIIALAARLASELKKQFRVG